MNQKQHEQALKRVHEMTRMRTQVEMLSVRVREQMGQIVGYAEALGALFSTGRPMLDMIHETWPDLGEESCELEKDFQQVFVSFRRAMYGLIPRDKLTEMEEEAVDAHSTGPGFPETTEEPSPADSDGGDEGPHGAEVGAPPEGEAPDVEASPPGEAEAEDDAAPPEGDQVAT